jgi:uncharacterized protein (TIGR04255 family)
MRTRPPRDGGLLTPRIGDFPVAPEYYLPSGLPARTFPRRQPALARLTRMPFPESPRVVYEHNPLTQVVTQLQFPSILSISAPPVEFQERIRANYPIYKREVAAVMPEEIAGVLQKLNIDLGVQGTRHSFSTEDGKRELSLTQDFLALREERYTRWEHFFAELQAARGAVEELYRPALYSRVGLRYINEIDRAALGLADTPWSSLLNPALVGILGDARIVADVAELVSVTLVKLTGVPGGAVQLRHGLQADKYVIDADFFTTERSATDDIYSTLALFNRTSGNLFRWAISPILSAALRPAAVD